jgi:hypothetical protein
VTRAGAQAVWPYLVRLVPWPGIVAAGGVAALVCGVAPRPKALHWTLVVLTAAVAVAGVLDDPAATVVASSPTSLRRRWGLRLMLALPVVGACAGAGLALLAARTGVGRADALLELGGWVAVALALAAISLRRNPAAPAGAVAGPLVLAVAAVAALLPERITVHPVAGHRVAWVAVMVLGAVAVAVLATDPAARPLRSRAAGRARAAQPATPPR